jgi:hypothetical protein
MSELTAKDLELFARFRITPGLLALADVHRVSDREAREDYGIQAGGDLSGIIFPYGVNGHRATARLRRDHVPLDKKGRPFAKYLSPKGDSRHAYILSDEVLQDVSIPALIVEAEKSVLAIAAWAQRFGIKILPVGLGGAESWSAKRGHKLTPNGAHEPQKGMLPELDYLKDGRAVRIIFDTNVQTNRRLLTARNKLVKRLKAQGAHVQVINLPVAPNINGPDDFLAAQTDETFFELLNAAEGKPTVVVDPGTCGDAANRAEEELVKHAEGLGIFERAGQVVRVVTLREPETSAGLRRPVGTTLIEPMDQYQMLESLERLCDFKKSTKSGKLKPIDCPGRVAAYYSGRTGTRLLPVLVGTIMAPLMRDDGTIVQDNGFDEQTGLFLVSDETWLPVPERPTREDALEALATLMAPFIEFAFVAPVDRSILLAGLLTAIQRRLLFTAPLLAFSAPKQREGKSMLCDAHGILATGRCAPSQVVSHLAEEFRKSIYTCLAEGLAVVNLDNLERPLKSEALSMALTQDVYRDRTLGVMQARNLPTRTLWVASGTNVAFRGDLAVRVLVCHLDSRQERPEERTFKIPDLQEHLKAHRPEMVQAALTMLRAYRLAPENPVDLKPWGGFDEWSKRIRGPIAWLGLDDPASTRDKVIEDDPDRTSGVALLLALRQTYGAEPFLMSRALELSQTNKALHQAFLAVAEKSGHVDVRAVGWWSRRWKDRITDGLCLREADKDRGAVRWKITTD